MKKIYLFIVCLGLVTFLNVNAQTAYPDGTPHEIPGVIQAYAFDNGGEGVGYHKLTSGPATGNPVRADEAVVIEALTYEVEESDYCVASTEAGEWLKYTVNVQKTGAYDIAFITSGTGRGKFTVFIDGRKLTRITAYNGDDLSLYGEKYTLLSLPAGEHELRINIEEGGFNFAMMQFDINEDINYPIADLLDVQFVEVNDPVSSDNISKTAYDASPTQNPIYDVGTNLGNNGPASPKVYPTVSFNSIYNKPTAHITGQQDRGDDGKGQSSGSGVYRIDWVDYSDILANSSKDDNPNYPNYQDADPLPLNDIGETLNEQFSMEVIFKVDKFARRIYPFSGTQSMGAGIQIEDANSPRLRWYIETDDNPMFQGQGGGGGRAVVAEWPELLTADRYYHAIGTYYWDKTLLKGKMVLYVDGENVAEVESEENFRFKHANSAHADALAQWFCLGGDSRAVDHPHFNQHVNGTQWDVQGLDNMAERIFEGEIVAARMYGWAISETEAQVLYNVNNPAGIAKPSEIAGTAYAKDNTLYLKGFKASSLLSVYDVLGLKVAGKILKGDDTITLPRKGIYIVSASDKGKTYSVKVLNK